VPLQPPRRRLELLLVRQDAQHDGPVQRHDDLPGTHHLRSHLLPVLRAGDQQRLLGEQMKREIENRNGFSSLLLNGLKEIWSHNGDVGL
jgi:hypothetical protein